LNEELNVAFVEGDLDKTTGVINNSHLLEDANIIDIDN
jgi:hypothetical protein